MSELRVMSESPGAGERVKSLWPAAVMILLLVFAPAAIAWGMLALHP